MVQDQNNEAPRNYNHLQFDYTLSGAKKEILIDR